MPAVFADSERTLTPEGIQSLLREIRSTAGRSNPEVRGIDMQNMMQAKNAGFPKFLYHDSLEPVQVLNQAEEAGLLSRGFRREYKHRSFPTWIYRRNMSSKFAGLLHNGDPDPAANSYVESRLVQDQKSLDRLMKEKASAVTGQWCVDMLDIAPLPETSDEDPNVTVARLQGQLDEARRKAEKGA